jgi:prepilin-type N-terminal cleavage/methylation domain-containing protein
VTVRASASPDSPSSREPDGEDGFALVELLVSLALVATMAALIALFIGQLRGFGAAAERLAVAREAQVVSDYVEGLAERAIPLALMSDDPAERRYLVGTASSVRFAAIARTGYQRQSLREVEIATTGATGGPAIGQVLRPRRFGVPTHEITVQTETLLPSRARIRFRYLSRREGEDAWSDEWQELGALPKAISIIVTMEREGKTFEAESLAILHLSRPTPR